MPFHDHDLNLFSDVGNKLADAAGEVIRKYFRKKFEILDKEDSSKVLEFELFSLRLGFTCDDFVVSMIWF